MKQLSQNGLRLIKSFEGCRLTAYDDLQPNLKLTASSLIKGTLTIGWGHTGNVQIGQTITQEQADYLFENDLKRYVTYVNDEQYVSSTKKLNQNQFDALVSFCYNCGPGNLKKLCYNVNLDTISTNILKYNKAKGQVLLGLVRRREAEKQLFIAPVVSAPTPSIEQRLVELENEVKKLTEQSKTLPVPKWAIEEFPNILDYINTPTGTHDFWRSVIISLRLFTNK